MTKKEWLRRECLKAPGFKTDDRLEFSMRLWRRLNTERPDIYLPWGYVRKVVKTIWEQS